jgi:cation:H+ antiporter
MNHLLLLAAGLGVLTVGAESLVRGASGIAARLDIPPLVIGLTVVAFGTSAPELAVSVGAALSGQADIALGNVVGSNIFNILLILGLSALVAPLLVTSQLVRVDVPLMIGCSLVVLLFALDNEIDRIEGVILFVSLLLYVGFQVRVGRRERLSAPPAQASDVNREERRLAWMREPLYVLVGLALLVWGARLLVDSAVAIARSLEVSELVIGLTIVAGGTSLPELATSVIASIRGERDIAVGNVVGSNVFNLLGVLGLGAIVAPASIAVPAEALRFDLPVMLAVAVACLPIFVTGMEIARWEGALFLAYYVAYTGYVLLAALGDGSLAIYSKAMLFFVLPLTAATLAILLTRDLLYKNGRTRGGG